MGRALFFIVAVQLSVIARIEYYRAVSFDQFRVALYRSIFHFWPEPLASPAMYATYDAQHYLYLATHGYREAGQSMAFFPLWPALIRAFSFGSRELGALVAALLLANALSLAGLLLLWRSVRARMDSRTADDTLVFLLAFPAAFYFCLPYTESLFLLLSVSCLVLLDRQRVTPAQILGATLLSLAAALVRPVGICLAVPLAYTLFVQRRYRWLPVATVPLSSLAIHRALVGMLALHGDQLSAYQVSFLNQQAPSNVYNLPLVVRSLFQIQGWHTYVGSAMDRFFFIAVIGILLVKVRDPRWRMFALYGLALAWVSGSAPLFTSFTRYTLLVLPVFVALAGWARKRRWVVIVYLLVAVPLQSFLLFRHIHNDWAG